MTYILVLLPGNKKYWYPNIGYGKSSAVNLFGEWSTLECYYLQQKFLKPQYIISITSTSISTGMCIALFTPSSLFMCFSLSEGYNSVWFLPCKFSLNCFPNKVIWNILEFMYLIVLNFVWSCPLYSWWMTSRAYPFPWPDTDLDPMPTEQI